MTEILITALGLAMDAAAVSVSAGMSMKKFSLFQCARIALYFGIFQAVMPVLGWGAGYFAGKIEFIGRFGHWAAALILGYIGARMILEGIQKKEEDESQDYSDSWVLLGLAVATSIDALAAGFSFALLDIDIISASLIIGAVTFVLSIIGAVFGKRIGSFFGRGADIFGGSVLILIGLKILLEEYWKNGKI
ncbi:MAG TPA: manganese efflux pump MntP family protein [Leptospiraceae bacterium]|nr:manganese efflux pump MntP family protein [Leptospiraceae bacterium]HMY68659.1 manganese efflux pump MntP family protein [Leptospiraceae bacterium]HMZ58704.1 manganese efflux pump MntP family protein [Leptospiraceae bacterium]HNF16785.1 manganese efflux pump MntP family protein [Leptospiraceae bacterium]HNF24875.1 manganese efflux pump MntP family protein [Leptospiraceae bacterium]